VATAQRASLTAAPCRAQDQYGDHISNKDVLSAALYPSVFREYQDFRIKFGDQVARLPTRAFLTPLKEDEEITVALGEREGKHEVTIKYKAKGELQASGRREVFFETHGVPRVLEVEDRVTEGAARVVRDKADLSDIGSVGAPMGGDIVEVRAVSTARVMVRLRGPRSVCRHACRGLRGRRLAPVT
jgi:pyruvate carboxylase